MKAKTPKPLAVIASFGFSAQVDEFGNTNRPVQPFNGRPLVHVQE